MFLPAFGLEATFYKPLVKKF